MNIVFSEDDLRLFGQASGDYNPLHLSAVYARSTSFGQPVVFGVLGVVASLAELDAAEASSIQTLAADFHRPMFVGVSYTATRMHRNGSTTVRLFDGSVNVLSVTVTLGQIAGAAFKTKPGFNVPPLPRVSKRLSWPEVLEAGSIEGEYRTDSSAVEKLLLRFGVSNLAATTVESLLWSSYLVGMELPGEKALFFRCVLKFPALDKSPVEREALHFSAQVRSTNAAIYQIRIAGSLTGDGRQLCSGEFVAFYRPDVKPLMLDSLGSSAPNVSSGEKKVALVLGASRGLGAAISALFAQRRIDVIACARSGAAWTDELSPDDAERVQAETLDAADTGSLAALRKKIESKFGRLDYLVCNACPPIPALRLEPNAFDRLQSYLTESVALSLAPMCVFLDLLKKSGGALIVISSSAVDAPVRDWPHYVAAKAAVEAFASVAAKQYEGIRALVFRPERMLTDMTNTPVGRANAESPARVADFIVSTAVRGNSVAGYEVIPVGEDELRASAPGSEELVSR